MKRSVTQILPIINEIFIGYLNIFQPNIIRSNVNLNAIEFPQTGDINLVTAREEEVTHNSNKKHQDLI